LNSEEYMYNFIILSIFFSNALFIDHSISQFPRLRRMEDEEDDGVCEW